MQWNCYNRAMVPACAPHETVDTTAIKDGSIWKSTDGSKPLLASWPSEFDCGFETAWWYVIKDTPFDVSALKSKRRYNITKARRYFSVRTISPTDYAKELYDVQVAAYSDYPEKYRRHMDYDDFVKDCASWGGTCFAAFRRDEDGNETDLLCAYSVCVEIGRGIDFIIQKANPAFEKYQVNAALVDAMLTFFDDALQNGSYIINGSRHINHETNFQDYLETYFCFRKAYCKLNVAYRPILRPFVSILYVFRKLLKKLDHIRIVHLINSVLTMEEIRRACRKDQP